MSWGLVTEDWRLKLLGLGLAILMLGAVAFSQNPPTQRPLDVGLNFTVPPNIVLINPPTNAPVTYSGLAEVIAQVNPSNLTASVDATRALPGTAVKLNIVARTLIQNVAVTQPAPIVVNIDTFQTKPIPLNIAAPTAAGWAISKAVALCPTNPCTTVSFTGPVSWEATLKAAATNPVTMGDAASGCSGLACTHEAPNQTIVLRNSSGVLDLSSPKSATVPTSTLDIPVVNLHVEAVAGITSSTVPLVVAPPAQPPPPGYQITAVSISPLTLLGSGDPPAPGPMPPLMLPGGDP